MKKEEKTISMEEKKETKAAKKSTAEKKSAAKKGTKAKTGEAADVKLAAAESEEKKPAAKKATAKKAEVEPKVSAVVEYEGRSVLIKNIVAKAIKAYKKANKGVVIKKVDIYIKPEENAAYYVINGDSSPSYKVEL